MSDLEHILLHNLDTARKERESWLKEFNLATEQMRKAQSKVSEYTGAITVIIETLKLAKESENGDQSGEFESVSESPA